MGPVVRLIGSGIGLASEALAHRKQKKIEAANASANSQEAQSSGTIGYPAQENNVVEVSDEHGEELVSTG